MTKSFLQSYLCSNIINYCDARSDSALFSGGRFKTSWADDWEYYDDVLMFDPNGTDWNYWKKIGTMKTARAYHGASLVKMDDVIPYCN